MKALRVLFLAAVVALLAPTVAQSAAYELNGGEDFVRIAEKGFTRTINNAGAFVTNVGSFRNDYAWGHSLFNGSYYQGTARDVGCYLTPSDPPDPLCPAVGATPGVNQRAEIWRYTPVAGQPHQGTWTRVYVSPAMTGVANSARDVGYRAMNVCSVPSTAAPRLWIGTFGMGGRVISTTNGTTYSLASINGLGLVNLGSGTADLGYRGLQCFANQLFIAPSGRQVNPLTAAQEFDADLPYRPVVLANTNPTSQLSAWRIVANTRTHATLGDPGNDGVFEMLQWNNRLYIGVWNRVTGFEVWRTDGTAGGGTGCPTTGQCTWTKIIDNGGGRPLTNGVVRSAGVSAFKIFDGFLYAGISDAAAVNPQPTEVIRILPNDQWELVVGERRTLANMTNVGNFNCFTTASTPAGSCDPVSGLGHGFGIAGSTSASPQVPSPTTQGRSRYVWRFEVYGDRLYAGNLDISGNSNTTGPAGFDLWRSDLGSATGGNTWSVVNDTGFGNSGAYGVRSMVTVPGGTAGWGPNDVLMIGTANIQDDVPNGGLEVYAGTCGTEAPPRVTLNYPNDPSGVSIREELLPFDPIDLKIDGWVPAAEVEDGNVTFTPNGSGVAALCDSLTPTPYEWFDGDHTMPDGSCAGTIGVPLAPAAATATAALPVGGIVRAAGTPFTDHPFTLRVTETEGGTGCAVYHARSTNLLPPTAVKITAPVPSCGPSPLPTCANPVAGSTSTPEYRVVGTDDVNVDDDATLERVAYVKIAGECTPGTNEIQTLGLTGTPTTGTFTLTFNGQTTAGIAFNANAAAVQAALEALSTVGAGNVTVTGPLTALVVRFASPPGGGLPGGSDAPAITADLAGLPDGAPAFLNTETRKGGEGAAMALCAWNLGNNIDDVEDTTETTDDELCGLLTTTPTSVETCVRVEAVALPTTTANNNRQVTLRATDANGLRTDGPAMRIRVSPVALPDDLTAVSVAATTSPATQDAPQTVRVRVANNGTIPESYTVTLVDLSGGSTIGPAATSAVVGPLAVGATTTSATDVQFTWTPTTLGPHNLQATVNLATDGNTADNVATATVTVNAAPPLVNLTAVSVAATTSPAVQNSAQNVNVIVRNNGSTAAANFSVTLMDDPPGAAPPVAVGAPQTIVTLAGLTTASALAFSWTPTTTGTHALTATVETLAGDTIVDNIATVNVLVNPPPPAVNLTAVSVAATTSPALANATQNVNVIVRNNGTNAAGPFSVTLFDNPPGTPPNAQVGPAQIIATLAGLTTASALAFPWTPTNTPGTHVLTATVEDLAGDNINDNTTTANVVVNADPLATVPATPAASWTRTGSNDATVTWTNVLNETSYGVQRCRTNTATANCTTWTTLSSATADTTSRTQSNLADDYYRWRVRACNANGCSPYSTPTASFQAT